MATNKNKDEFIKRLAIMTPAEINQIIQEKGKKPRLVPAFCKALFDNDGNPITLN